MRVAAGNGIAMTTMVPMALSTAARAVIPAGRRNKILFTVRAPLRLLGGDADSYRRPALELAR